MCRYCKDITNIHERIANHDFMEQMREFYGLEEKRIKDRRNKNTKKSVIARIEHQIAQMLKAERGDFAERLMELRESSFDASVTPQAFDAIMDEYNEVRTAEIFAYFKSKG